MNFSLRGILIQGVDGRKAQFHIREHPDLVQGDGFDPVDVSVSRHHLHHGERLAGYSAKMDTQLEKFLPLDAHPSG